MSDLLTLIEQDLGPGQRKGSWYFWRCPFHNDRLPSFGVKGDRYHCFGCKASGDAVTWLVEYRKMDKREALRLVKGDKPQKPQPQRKGEPQTPQIKPAAEPPEEWQVLAGLWLDDCHKRLFSPEGAKALAYLHKRGLADNTIRRFSLGYWRGGEVPGFGFEAARGITIPNFRNGALYGVKIRHPQGEPKYTSLKGSVQRLYVTASVVPNGEALLCEGEFDALIAWQELRDCVGVATFGSCSAEPNEIDLLWLALASRVIVAYDNDEPGQQGAQKLTQLLGRKAVIAQLPKPHKDITDAYIAGVDLWRWLKQYLEIPPSVEAWMAEAGARVATL